MLGDFMITTAGQQSALRKKIRRLRPTMAIGWTGSEFAADTATIALHDALSPAPTRDEVDSALRALDVSLLVRPVTFLGWVGDPEPTAFKWQSAAQDTVYWTAEHDLFEGSGG